LVARRAITPEFYQWIPFVPSVFAPLRFRRWELRPHSRCLSRHARGPRPHQDLFRDPRRPGCVLHRALYRGHDAREDPIGFKRILGYVPEETYLYPHLTGEEYLELVAQLRAAGARCEAEIARLLELFSLGGDRYSPISSYSKGKRQNVLISTCAYMPGRGNLKLMFGVYWLLLIALTDLTTAFEIIATFEDPGELAIASLGLVAGDRAPA
jgi:hypothetical protein